MDVRVLTGLVCPAARPPARPLGVRQYPGALKGCGVKKPLCIIILTTFHVSIITIAPCLQHIMYLLCIVVFWLFEMMFPKKNSQLNNSGLHFS